MNIAAIAGIGIVAAAIAVLIKKQNPEYSMMISIGAGVILLILILSQVTPAIRQMSDLVSSAGMPAEYAGILFKSLRQLPGRRGDGIGLQNRIGREGGHFDLCPAHVPEGGRHGHLPHPGIGEEVKR